MARTSNPLTPQQQLQISQKLFEIAESMSCSQFADFKTILSEWDYFKNNIPCNNYWYNQQAYTSANDTLKNMIVSIAIAEDYHACPRSTLGQLHDYHPQPDFAYYFPLIGTGITIMLAATIGTFSLGGKISATFPSAMPPLFGTGFFVAFGGLAYTLWGLNELRDPSLTESSSKTLQNISHHYYDMHNIHAASAEKMAENTPWLEQLLSYSATNLQSFLLDVEATIIEKEKGDSSSACINEEAMKQTSVPQLSTEYRYDDYSDLDRFVF